jgi:hypothetical protein
MKMEIVPFERVGNLVFGTKRAELRKMLGSNFTTFRKTPWSINTTDDYSTLGLHLYYSELDELEFVEMFPPAEPIFMGVDLLQEDIENILKVLRESDPDPETDEAGYTFHKIGIALYIEDKLEAVSVFPKDYYSAPDNN